ncbi:voltage-dependent T-type calcium channel subunit alpha-1H [Caerostris extrusa]|uniref:Voltage-dependent T-type calcium channel subunit alpha-1H n=1 Tax=Caerostris extrusa TaxID=172846 RepID=A0AAV4P1U8_CAEEX|nr:voltage-dependent T-type calcium channel subunit alpha-1H [Caerostris extrusa]
MLKTVFFSAVVQGQLVLPCEDRRPRVCATSSSAFKTPATRGRTGSTTDNLGQALTVSGPDVAVRALFQGRMGEHHVHGTGRRGVDQQPVENYNEWRLLYFISFLLLVAFFVLNMFVGVVVENFHRCREQQEREERARRAAKRAKKMDKKRRKMRSRPTTPTTPVLASWCTGSSPPSTLTWPSQRSLD